MFDEDNCETWEKEIGDIGGTSRDVAHVKWGGGWRMPTEAEFRELLDEDNCTWKWITTLGGHEGCKVTSKKTGNWIFLPAAGSWHGTLLDYAYDVGLYWSSTPIEGDFQLALRLGFDRGLRYADWGWHDRYVGLPVRPVGEF